MERVVAVLDSLIRDVSGPSGSVAVDQFPHENDIALKLLEFRMLLGTLSREAAYIRDKFDLDGELHQGTTRQRLQRLLAYLHTTRKLLKAGLLIPLGTVLASPDFSLIPGIPPELCTLLTTRWNEIQTACNAGANLAAVVLMGSTLEGLLLARATADATLAQRARRSPLDSDGNAKPVAIWNLSELISVAGELGWIRVELSDFRPILRRYHQLIHPFQQLQVRLPVSDGDVQVSWHLFSRTAREICASV